MTERDLILDHPADCTCTALRMATRIVTQAYDAALKPAGLTSSQFTLLANVKGRGPIRISELAKVLVMDRTTLTRNLKPVESRGLVRIEPGEDQRERVVAITEAGSTLFEDARLLWLGAQTRLVARLSEDRWRGLMADLRETIAQQ